MNKMLKIEKHYQIVNKFGAFGFLTFSFIFFIGSLLMIEIFLKIPLDTYWYIPLLITLLTILTLLFVKDLLLFLKIWLGYNTIVSFFAIVLFTFEIIYISLPLPWYFKITIYSFLLLFYGILFYDIKNIITSFQSHDIRANINKNLHNFAEDSKIQSLLALRSLTHNNYNTNKLLMMKLFLLFGLPFALMGKGASYFLVLGAGEYFSAKEYIFIVIGFILMIFIFVIIFPPFFKIAMRLKYKNDDK